ncbi:(d)CMP kinase [Blattabacterium cuenoti]|uniref:(d)CMP kinase n=1 Tax=Blattabacterium cuenoti TaxID=1653831 RepID=UPI00163B9A44|nr:(d)CMP kinase [Blattabacterium cuenoti]
MKNNKKIIISIDGFSSSGKSTLSKKISRKLNYKYIDTGAIYRCVTLLAIRKNVFNSDLWNIKNFIPFVKNLKWKFYWDDQYDNMAIILNNENIRSEIRSIEVTKKVPLISKIPEIREILISIQKNMGKKKGIVVDGRDIGNCVFPKSELKFFINGSLETRSYRRYIDFYKKGIKKISYEKIKNHISYRDEMDIKRKISPLKKSWDHIEIDNSSSIDQQLNLIFKIINEKIYETIGKKNNYSNRRIR